MRINMKTIFVAGLLGVFSTLAMAQSNDWFDPSKSNFDNANRAEADDVSATDATRYLIQQGGDPADVARAVVKAYDSCDSLYDAIGTAVKESPQDANAIAAAVAGLNRCPCSAQGVWARGRVQSRVRMEHRDLSFAVRGACACTVAIAESAASAMSSNDQATALMNSLSSTSGNCGCAESAFVGTANGMGDRADEWIESLDEKEKESGGKVNRPEIIDAIGQVEGSQKQPWIGSAGITLERKPDSCGRDIDLFDEFEWDETYRSGQRDLADCEQDSKQDQEGERDELILSRYVDQPGKYRYASIYNDTDENIDLAAGGYVLEVYAQGDGRAARVIPLTGVMPKGSAVTVASSAAPGEIRENSILVSDRLNLQGAADAVVLRRLGTSAGMACPAEVLAARTVYTSFPVAVIPERIDPIIGEPRTDDSLVDPERGGDIASPN